MLHSGIYGLCIGDALGVLAECRTRESLRENPTTGMDCGGIRRQPAGYWSDDSSMTLCTVASFGEAGAFHTHDLMNRFLKWWRDGEYTPGGECFDFGHTTSGPAGTDDLNVCFLNGIGLPNRISSEDCQKMDQKYPDADA